MNIAETFLAELEIEAPLTRKLIERAPNVLLDWTPHAKSMSIRRVAGHLANILWWGEVTLTQDELNLDPATPPRPQPASVAEILATWDANLVKLRGLLKTESDTHMNATWTFKIAGNALFAMPRWMVMRRMVFSHLIHHRAQLGVCLRLNNVPIPGMYGPSADES